MRRSLSYPVALALALTLLSGCMGRMIVDIGLRPDNHGQKFEFEREKIEHRMPGIMPWFDSLRFAGVMRDTFILRNGYRLHAYYCPAERPSGKTAVVVHGYHVNPINIMTIARMYRDSLGYNLLTPSLHYHGLSEGAAIQMGWLDRLDVIEWSRVAHETFSDTLQVMHGVSMGAATVMMASGEESLPEYVRGFVEDCGYTSVWDEVNYAIIHYTGLKPDHIMQTAERRVTSRFGWSMAEASSTDQLAKCDRPMLFIHGEADQLVPPHMAQENFNSKVNGYREIWIAPDSAHSMSFTDHPAEYTGKVREFLREHVE